MHLEEIMFMDVAERRIGRSTDYQVQREHYSGKKGCHTLKNVLATNPTGKVIYLWETFEGDRRAVNLVFLGTQAEGVEVCLPKKKPKGKELSNF